MLSLLRSQLDEDSEEGKCAEAQGQHSAAVPPNEALADGRTFASAEAEAAFSKLAQVASQSLLRFAHTLRGEGLEPVFVLDGRRREAKSAVDWERRDKRKQNWALAAARLKAFRERVLPSADSAQPSRGVMKQQLEADIQKLLAQGYAPTHMCTGAAAFALWMEGVKVRIVLRSLPRASRGSHVWCCSTICCHSFSDSTDKHPGPGSQCLAGHHRRRGSRPGNTGRSARYESIRSGHYG